MPAQLMDGKAVSRKVLEEVSLRIRELGIKPKLALVRVGEDEGSRVYVGLKEKACKQVGIESKNHVLPDSTTEEKLLGLVETLNRGPAHGILVQLPLPAHIDPQRVLLSISPEKDVDGLHPENVGRLMLGLDGPKPCTPAGVIRLLDDYGVTIEGRDAVIVGRNDIVGKPLAQMLTQRNATVTVCHSRTRNLASHTGRAEILVVAVGKPGLVTESMVREGAVVVDVGINRLCGKLTGDVDFEGASKKASLITPVPGGVGPMTVAMLMRNTLEACGGSAGRG
jgi:methylenetetrahydrofolate dehydrogenase (NADP+) / methenyltetrahydrofolate cyclohydrolase